MINLRESMDRSGIELTTPGSAVGHVSTVRHITECARLLGIHSKLRELPKCESSSLGSIESNHDN